MRFFITQVITVFWWELLLEFFFVFLHHLLCSWCKGVIVNSEQSRTSAARPVQVYLFIYPEASQLEFLSGVWNDVMTRGTVRWVCDDFGSMSTWHRSEVLVFIHSFMKKSPMWGESDARAFLLSARISAKLYRSVVHHKTWLAWAVSLVYL